MAAATILFLAVVFVVFFVRVYRIENKFSLGIINPKDSFLIDKGSFLAKRALIDDSKFAGKYEKIGWVTDIHADRFKRRTIDSGTIFPRQYEQYLPKVFDAMKSQGIDTVIATGDNTNSGDDNYARMLAKIAQEKRMDVIWVRGNHDNDKVMSILAPGRGRYYYYDYGNTRIVALDDVEANGDYQGSIDDDQLNWIKDVLKTDKNVIVSMHIPIFDGGNGLMTNYKMKGGDYMEMGGLIDKYAELEKILHDSGNVKIVISGHWHVPWRKEYDGIKYFGEAALTRESYTGAYGVIDLKNFDLQYKFAK